MNPPNLNKNNKIIEFSSNDLKLISIDKLINCIPKNKGEKLNIYL